MKNSYNTNLNLPSVDGGLLLLRLGSGALMLTHGYPKLMTFFGKADIVFVDLFEIGDSATLALVVFAEFVCSILLMVGLATRLAVIPLIITMATAVFHIHATDDFSRKELPLLYLIIFITLLITGAGKFSLDFAWVKKIRQKKEVVS